MKKPVLDVSGFSGLLLQKGKKIGNEYQSFSYLKTLKVNGLMITNQKKISLFFHCI